MKKRKRKLHDAMLTAITAVAILAFLVCCFTCDLWPIKTAVVAFSSLAWCAVFSFANLFYDDFKNYWREKHERDRNKR